MAGMCREVKYILGAPCIKEMIMEESIRKEVRYKQTQKIKD